MIYSMTGYGSALLENDQFSVYVELKSLNNKNQDFFLKLPKYYSEEELKVRNFLNTHLNKGKITATIKVQSKINPVDSTNNINKTFIKSLYQELSEIQKELQIQNEISLVSLLQVPNVFLDSEQKVSEEEWEITEKALLLAIENLKISRANEGKALHEDIFNQLQLIEILIPEIQIYENERIENLKNKLKNAFKEYGSELNITPERFEQELIFYLEKFDINEEKIRLQSHIQYFKETVEKEDIIGKKLQFIAQEMGREINTIGSKANEFHIQKIVVQMKDALEKIKEQVNNIL